MNTVCSYPTQSSRTAYAKGCRCVTCKNYKKECAKKYYLNNKEKIDKKVIENQKQNKLYYQAYRAEYYLNNMEKIKTTSKQTRIKNRKRRNLQHKQRMQNDPIYALKKKLRDRIRNAVIKHKLIKNKHTIDILGCSIENIKVYIESKFKPGMSWDNYGYKGWHIDHIIPLASAKNDIDQIYKLCHYTNLQPLWESENCRKGSKIL